MLGWPKRCKLAHLAFMCEYNYKRLKLAQLPGQLGVFLTRSRAACMSCPRTDSTSAATDRPPPGGSGAWTSHCGWSASARATVSLGAFRRGWRCHPAQPMRSACHSELLCVTAFNSEPCSRRGWLCQLLPEIRRVGPEFELAQQQFDWKSRSIRVLKLAQSLGQPCEFHLLRPGTSRMPRGSPPSTTWCAPRSVPCRRRR
jgi:hypothetical protein